MKNLSNLLLGAFLFFSVAASAMEIADEDAAAKRERLSRMLWGYAFNVNGHDCAIMQAGQAIARGADVNYSPPVNKMTAQYPRMGMSCLSVAAQHANYLLCELLLRNGADVYYLDRLGHLPLFYAAVNCQPIANLFMRTMLRTPVPGQADRMRAFMLCLTRMPLEGALRSVFPPILRQLMKDEREDRAYEGLMTLEPHGFSAETMVASRFKEDCAKQYFPHRAKEDERTELMKLAARGRIFPCEVWPCQLQIHAYRAVVTQATPSGITALHEAARCGSDDICRLLLESGAEVFCLKRGGLTPLRTAINALEGIGEFAIPKQGDAAEPYNRICDSLMQSMIALNRDAALADLRKSPDCPTKTQLLLKYFPDANPGQNEPDQQ